MARTLTNALDLAQLDLERRPAFRVEVYDVRSGENTVGDIVRSLTLGPLTGPRDFSADVLQVEVDEQASDFDSTGVASSRIQLTVKDPNGLFNPRDGDESRWLRRDNVVRLYEGDARVNPDDWPVTFTGIIRGQPGYAFSRATRRAEVTVSCSDRSLQFLKYERTSNDFGKATGYQSMATDIATDEMGLDSDEIAFAGWGTTLNTGHNTTQFVEQSPLTMIAQIMFPEGFMPRFNGEGKLTQSSGAITKAASRIYADDRLFFEIAHNLDDQTAVNRVCVIGLAANMTKIGQPTQELKTVRITTGYFAQDEEITVYWSEDKTVIAENIIFDVLRSVNGGLSFLGGGEEFTEIPAPGGQGTIGGTITVDTGFAPYIIIFLGIVYVVFAVIPDLVVLAETVPVGRLIQAIALAAILLLMTKIGRGEYLLKGDPFEYVFAEIRACAQVSGVSIADRNALEIDNHLVQTQAVADAIAETVLLRKQAQANSRTVSMLHDLRLEPDDVFERADGKRYMIKSIRRTLRRGAGAIVAAVNCFEVTPGVTP